MGHELDPSKVHVHTYVGKGGVSKRKLSYGSVLSFPVVLTFVKILHAHIFKQKLL
jgi:hypothetical protein